MFVQFKGPNRNAPPGKLAEAELHFTADEGPILDGLVLTGFTVWKRRDGSGLFLEIPGRQYEKDGQKKTFDYLRFRTQDDKAKHDYFKSLVIDEYERWAAGGAQ